MTAPQQPPAGTPQTSLEGTSKAFDLGSFTDGANAGPWKISINWGDGSTPTVFITTNDGDIDDQPHTFAIADQLHTFAANGLYSVNVRVANDLGLFSSKTFPVTVVNVAPIVTAAGDQLADFDIAQSFNLGSFTDPALDNPWKVQVNWGDGSPVEIFDQLAPGALDPRTHTYSGAGLFTVSVLVTDKDNGWHIDTFDVDVNGSAPEIALNGDSSVAEGSTYTLTFGSLTSNRPITGYTIHWGDGVSQTFSGSPSGTKTHSYLDGPNGYAITVDLNTANKAYPSSATLNVGVTNSAPTATGLTGPSVLGMGQTGAFTLTGVGDASSIDFADLRFSFATSIAGLVADYASAGTSSSFSTLFMTPGTNTLYARVYDKDGGVSSVKSFTLTIQQVYLLSGNLYVYGLSSNDTVAVTKVSAGVTISISGTSFGTFNPTGQILVYAGAGNDNVQIDPNCLIPVIVHGEAGNDTLVAGGGNDSLDGGEGNDWLVAISGAETLDGGTGNDTLTAGSGRDSLVGGVGNDSLLAATGNDILFGGEGDDTLTAGSGVDTLLGGDGADSMMGGSGYDTMDGGAGADTLRGGSGYDTMLGGEGADSMQGGSGFDTMNGGAGDDSITAGSGKDSMLGGEGADSLTGGSGNDTIDGGAGADTIKAGSGNDRIHGGEGNDWLSPGAGDDIVYAGAGNDEVVANAGNDFYDGGIGSDTLDGGTGADILVGGDGGDLLIGGAGCDFMIGGRDSDTLIGNANDDILIGGWTTYDGNLAALRQIINVWQGSGTYSERIAAITSESFDYSLVAGESVHDDGKTDYLTGDSGQDWFFANTDIGVLDVITDLTNNESNVDVE